ncbi:MAG TPA: hypothetical protein VN878_05610, partial [Usitatibacter sp.]|nr:hypothetical protein [Usitatibacter sp.]
FFATSLGLTYFSAPSKSGSVIQHLEAPTGKPAAGDQIIDVKPAAPASSAPAPAGNSTDKSSEIPK